MTSATLTPQRIAELEWKAQAFDELTRIISTNVWNANARIVYAGTRRLTANGRREDGWLIEQVPMWQLSKRIGMPARTCRDALKRLKGAGLVEWEVERPKGGDYKDAITTLKVRECLPPEFAPLPLTENGVNARRAAVEFRARKNQLEEIVKALECPECHKTGCMHVTIGAECDNCHATITQAELEKAAGVDKIDTMARRRELRNLKGRATPPAPSVTYEFDDDDDETLDHAANFATPPQEAQREAKKAQETAETDRVANFATPPSNDEIIEAAGFAHPPAANFAATSERAQPDIVSDAACAATTQSSTEDVISAAPEDELSPLWDDCVSTGVDTLAKLSADGAQFCRVYGRRAKVDHPGKQPFGDGPNGSGWKTPAALDVVAEHMRTGGNAGVLTGDNIKAADGDDRFASWMAHCRRNGRAMTKLIVRRDAWPRRGKALVKISDPDNLKGERFKLSPDPDASPVFEILSDGNAVVAGIHKSGATIEMHDLGEWVEMTAVEFRALVVAWLDSEYPADQYPDATWRALQSSLSASTPSQVRAARPRASVGMLDFAHIDAVPYEQQVRAAIQWFNDDPANVAAAQRLIDGARRKGKYFALRTNDTTPSTCAISDDAYRDFGDDGESRGVRDVFDIIAILDGRNKSRLIFENVNAWRKAHGAQPIPDKYAQPDSARSASAADGAR